MKVAILNAWGRLRTWQAHMVAHELPIQTNLFLPGILEALSGASVDVLLSALTISLTMEFQVDVIINAGMPVLHLVVERFGRMKRLLHVFVNSCIRRRICWSWGTKDVHHQGRFFQLGDILGVEREMGYSLQQINTLQRIERTLLLSKILKMFIRLTWGKY